MAMASTNTSPNLAVKYDRTHAMPFSFSFKLLTSKL